MQEHADELAALLVTEQGKSHGEARVEIDYAASFYEGSARRQSGSRATPCRARGRTSASSSQKRRSE
jgi:acyl-CoA reductase-like NAD-dependent aldehyde dehydrogenase